MIPASYSTFDKPDQDTDYEVVCLVLTVVKFPYNKVFQRAACFSYKSFVYRFDIYPRPGNYCSNQNLSTIRIFHPQLFCKKLLGMLDAPYYDPKFLPKLPTFASLNRLAEFMAIQLLVGA